MQKKVFPTPCVLIALVIQTVALPLDGPVVFRKPKVLIRKDNGKTDLVRSRIELHDDRIAVFQLDGGEKVHEFAYSEIKQAQYSFSKSPRWKSGAGAAVAVGVFAIPIFFMKGKRHWLTLQVQGDYAVLKLDKNIQRELLIALESKSGIEVERLGEDGKPG